MCTRSGRRKWRRASATVPVTREGGGETEQERRQQPPNAASRWPDRRGGREETRSRRCASCEPFTSIPRATPPAHTTHAADARARACGAHRSTANRRALLTSKRKGLRLGERGPSQLSSSLYPTCKCSLLIFLCQGEERARNTRADSHAGAFSPWVTQHLLVAAQDTTKVSAEPAARSQ